MAAIPDDWTSISTLAGTATGAINPMICGDCECTSTYSLHPDAMLDAELIPASWISASDFIAVGAPLYERWHDR